jgi:hypothetical protein
MNDVLCFGTLVLVLSMPATTDAAQPRACEMATDSLMNQKTPWPRIHRAAVKLPAHCFDGYFAGGISDNIVRKLGQDWYGFISTLSRHPDDSRFLRLILGSINETVDATDLKVLMRRARSCPARLAQQCASVLAKAKEALRP